jgi:hypothetical protein
MHDPEYRCPNCHGLTQPTSDNPGRELWCKRCGVVFDPSIAEQMPTAEEIPVAIPISASRQQPNEARTEAPKSRPLMACGVMAILGVATIVAVAVVAYAVAVGLKSAVQSGLPHDPPTKTR